MWRAVELCLSFFRPVLLRLVLRVVRGEGSPLGALDLIEGGKGRELGLRDFVAVRYLVLGGCSWACVRVPAYSAAGGLPLQGQRWNGPVAAAQ